MKKNLYISIDDQDRLDYLLQDSNGQVVLSGSAFHQDQLPEFPNDANVVLIIPGASVLVLSLTLPKTSRAQLLKAIPYALEEQLIEDVDELHFVPSKQDIDGTFSVAVVKKQLMQQWRERCISLSLYPQIAVADYFAVPLLENNWHLYLCGEHALLRQAKLQGMSIPQIQLKEMLSLCLAEQAESLPDKIVLDYDDGNEHFMVEILEELPVPVEMAAADQFSMELFATGLEQTVTFNLLQGEYAVSKPKNKSLRLWKFAAGLLMAWFVIWLLGNISQYVVYHRRLKKVQVEVSQLYKQAFPQAKSQVEPRLRIQRALQNVQNAGSGGTFLGLLAQVGQQLMSQRNMVTIENFNYRNDTLTLALSANSFQEFSALTQALEKQGLSVQQQNSSTQGKTVTARLLIKGKANG